MTDRLPPPWTFAEIGECYRIEDAAGQPIAYVYFDDPPRPTRVDGGRLTRETARRVAANVARLPDLLHALKIVNWRQQNTGKDGF